MAVRYYDEAIYRKIQSWVTDDRMIILKPDEVTRLFQNIADKTNDKPIRLPLIALSRDRSLTLSIPTRRPLSYDGLKVGTSEEKNKSIQLNAIPFTTNYQLDLYTQTYEEADVYMREIIFNFSKNPRIEIEIPYNGVKIKHLANIVLQPEVSDNSDISERLFPGQFTRWTFQLELQDAYLFNTPVKDNWKIEADPNTSLEEIEPTIEVISIEGEKAHNGFTHISEEEIK